jgi:predicted small integral membrane protein
MRYPASTDHPAKNLALVKLIALSWLTVWLGFIAFNNITDFRTNRSLISQMFQMNELKTAPVRGRGLTWRALPDSLASPTLVGVIVFELVIVALLARALPAALRHYRFGTDATVFLKRANLALAAALGLPSLFLAGGMWFGYWLFMGPVQQVHLTLLIIVVVVTVMVNLPGGTRATSPMAEATEAEPAAVPRDNFAAVR